MNLRKLYLLVALAVLGTGISPAAWSVDVARVNERVISDMDLRAVLNMSGYNEGQRESMMKDSATRRQILNSLIDQEVLIGEAMKKSWIKIQNSRKRSRHLKNSTCRIEWFKRIWPISSQILRLRNTTNLIKVATARIKCMRCTSW